MADAVDREDFKALKSELGDLLFQIVFHAEMADEKGIFNLTDVINELNNNGYLQIEVSVLPGPSQADTRPIRFRYEGA